MGYLFVLPLPSMGKESIMRFAIGTFNYFLPWRLFKFSWQEGHSKYLHEWPKSLFSSLLGLGWEDYAHV
jgi:hypothetical protein